MAEPSPTVPSTAEATVAEFSRVVHCSREHAPPRHAEPHAEPRAGAAPAPAESVTAQLVRAAEQIRSAEAARAEAEAAARAAIELVTRLTTEMRAALRSSVGCVEVLRGRGRNAASGAAGEMQRAAVDSMLALHEYMLGLVEDANRAAACAAVALAPAQDLPRAEDA